MRKEFKKYDRKCIRVVDIPICELNKLFSDNNLQIKIYYRCQEQSKCAISIENLTDNNLPATCVVGDFLGIKIIDWYWADNGYNVIIKYIPKQEVPNEKNKIGVNYEKSVNQSAQSRRV